MASADGASGGITEVPKAPDSPLPGARPFDWVRHWFYRLRHPTGLDLALGLVILGVLLTIESAYRMSFVPPGGDSGHWVATSYSFIGRPHPSDFTDQALLYPPLLFPLIGSFVVLTNNPFTAALLTGGALLVLYGVTSAHLARRYLRTPSGQLLFVGLAVLNGTSLQMLFWAGYPNFLGFAVLNEAMIFLLAALLTRGFWEWVGVGVFAGALYLTHDLSFVIFAAAAVVGGALFLLRERGDLTIFLHRGVVAAAGIFAAAYAGYYLSARFAGVTHAGYLYTNPTTYAVDPVALVFRPFYFAPAFFPRTAAVILTSGQTVELLLGVAAAVLLVVLGTLLLRPRRVPVVMLPVAGWIVAVLAVPALGYLAHVDTDYPRFAYFLPLPFALGAVLLGEWGIPRWTAWRARRPAPPDLPPPRYGTPVRSVGLRSADLGPLVGVALVLFLLYTTVSLPTVQRAEADFVNPTHSSQFVAAAEWIQQQPGGGEILTDAASARWVEAITDRTAYSTGPTWLHFYTEQILDDNLAYWALNSHYVATDNHAAFSYAGYNQTTFDSFPQYVAYLEGIPFPILRVAESSLSIGLSTTPNGTTIVQDSYSPSWGSPTYTLSPSAATITARFTTANFTLNETSSMTGEGSGTIQWFVLPAPHLYLRSVTFQLASPILSFLGGTVPLAGLNYSGNGAKNFTWAVRGPEGPLPNDATVAASGVFSVAPNVTRSFTAPALHPKYLLASFNTPTAGFALQLRLSAPGLSDPAITLPPTFDAHQFVLQNDIRFLMVQNNTANSATASYFAQEYGFQPAFQNSQWTVYEG